MAILPRVIVLLTCISLTIIVASCSPSPPTIMTSSPTATRPSPTITASASPTIVGLQPVTMIKIVLIAGGDDGRSGTPVGCNDSAILVEWEVEPTDEPVRTALEFLFSIDYQLVGPASLYNSLYQSRLQVDQITTPKDGPARIDLSGEVLMGGVCDQPRFAAQIEGTIAANADFKDFEVYINDRPIDYYLSNK